MPRAESTPVRMVVAVLATCVVASASLAFTYQLTKDQIAEQERIAEERAIQAVLPEAVDFELLAEDVIERADEVSDETPVLKVYSAEDGSGAALGWAVGVAPRGYGGPMNMVVGVDRDGLVTGVSIITQNETPGLGSKILTEPGFLDQFSGWDAIDVDAADKSFDAITGATKSSNGVRKGVLAAGYVYAEVLTEEGGDQ